MKQKTCMAAKVGAEKAKLKRKRRNARPVRWSNCLKSLREKYGLSLAAVAQSVGVSSAGMLYLERGTSDPTLSTALTISQFFGVPITQIWTQWRGK
jgi:DNA-binding XRE family transcriptional regulator